MTKATDSKDVWGDDGDVLKDLDSMTNEEIAEKTKQFQNNVKIMKRETTSLTHQLKNVNLQIEDNEKKVKMNKQLPHLVSNFIELLDLPPEDGEEQEGGAVDEDSARMGKSCVIKTTTRQTIYLPVIGLVEPEDLKPGDLIGVNKDSYLILDKLPTEHDSRVNAMEMDEKPTEDYTDIGGLDKQIEELMEAIVLPMTHKERFDNIGIKPPKGLLLHGPPGTGKTLLARACAAQTDA